MGLIAEGEIAPGDTVRRESRNKQVVIVTWIQLLGLRPSVGEAVEPAPHSLRPPHHPGCASSGTRNSEPSNSTH